jgi:hypothetical protein
MPFFISSASAPQVCLSLNDPSQSFSFDVNTFFY